RCRGGGASRGRRRRVLSPHRDRQPQAALRALGTGGVSDAALTQAYAYCHAVLRRSGSSFTQAFRLLGPDRRAALDAVYAFCRFVDDVADELEPRRPHPATLLARWRDELDRVYTGAPTHPIGVALADAVRRFALPRRHFTDLIRGVEMDLSRRRYQTFDELAEYCHLVASTVGLL